ncbi:DUF4192 domain-containing protein [Streptomyces griseoviridis]|uniref:DUF4192 domain-containing protein n=1 Tax=Streptomyces griseoviridis TaxID=45398 RepID=UPI0033C76D56
MTNHGETTGSSENGKAIGREAHGPRAGQGGYGGSARAGRHPEPTAYVGRGTAHGVTLRTPAELADALPYLLGYRPEDSIVLLALDGDDTGGRFGGRARLGIPSTRADWKCAARELVRGLVTGGERRGARPRQMVIYLCQEPAPGETAQEVMRRLAPLAAELHEACGDLRVSVAEALCIADGRFWSYNCGEPLCCPPEGTPMGLPGTSVLAAAATYAGLQVRGTLRELRARLQPWETAAALEQETALDAAAMALIPKILDDTECARVATETLELAERLMRRLAGARPVSGMLPADLRDDDLIGHDEAATLILGLQDRVTRDHAAEWMEGDEAGPALRLWRALARRCVGPYNEHAAAPLTLAGWVAWSTGDELEAREAFAMALGVDPEYLFARLLHQACNEGLDPESVRRCLRTERRDRRRPADQGSSAAGPRRPGDGQEPGPEENPTHVDTTTGDSSTPEPSRGRRRVRTGTGTGTGMSRPARTNARGSGATVPRPRTPAASGPGGTHPGSERADGSRPRPARKDTAQRRDDRSGDALPAGDGVEEGT